MASNTYTRTTITGTTQHSRKGTQGRPKGTGEGKKPRPFASSDANYERIKQKAKEAQMTVSAYVELAALMYEFS